MLSRTAATVTTTYFASRGVAPHQLLLLSRTLFTPTRTMSQFGGMKQPQFSSNFLFRQVRHMQTICLSVAVSVIHTFIQLFDRESCTYTYLLADTDSKEAILIDPVIELAQRDRQVLEDLGLNLVYARKFCSCFFMITFARPTCFKQRWAIRTFLVRGCENVAGKLRQEW